jgi:hypothetical protein
MSTLRVSVSGARKTGKTRLLAFIAESLSKLKPGDEYFDLAKKDIRMDEEGQE